MGLVFFYRMARIAAAPQPYGARLQRLGRVEEFFRRDLV